MEKSQLLKGKKGADVEIHHTRSHEYFFSLLRSMQCLFPLFHILPLSLHTLHSLDDDDARYLLLFPSLLSPLHLSELGVCRRGRAKTSFRREKTLFFFVLCRGHENLPAGLAPGPRGREKIIAHGTNHFPSYFQIPFLPCLRTAKINSLSKGLGNSGGGLKKALFFFDST